MYLLLPIPARRTASARRWLSLLPLLFSLLLAQGQPLREVDEDSTLVAAEQFPFSVYVLADLPASGLVYDVGPNAFYDRLAEQGIEVPRSGVLYGFALGGRWRRFYGDLRLSKQLFTQPETQRLDNGREVAVMRDFEAINAGLGYSFFQSRNHEVQLWLGIGSAVTTLYLNSSQSGASFDFDDLSPVPVPDAAAWPVFSHTNFYGDLALGWISGRPKGPSSLAETLRVGYRLGLQAEPWEALNYTVVNAPLHRLGQIYMSASFQIGFNFAAKK
mgnify:CR=1 FL=1